MFLIGCIGANIVLSIVVALQYIALQDKKEHGTTFEIPYKQGG